MITITRSLARQLRAVFRRTGVCRIGHRVRVVLLATPDTLHVRLKTQNVALEYRLAGEFQPEQLSLPFEFLADCEGRKDEPVTLQAQANGRVLVSWSDRGVPQMIQYDAEPSGQDQEFPTLPSLLQAVEPDLWTALADATQVADSDRIRYALDCLQLRGASGQIAAANGRHILVQSGYTFRREKPVVACSYKALWVEPDLYCQVRFLQWTRGGRLRSASFAGLMAAATSSCS